MFLASHLSNVADCDEPAPAHVPLDRHQPGGAEQGDDEQAEGDAKPGHHRGRRGDADAAQPTKVPHGDHIFREGRQVRRRTKGRLRQLVRAEHGGEHAASQARYTPMYSDGQKDGSWVA